mmetsp:Transcript_150775/g.281261  ORF Transcript_150775/g.281261 Transcript_150775/m.281261 type:complete len:1343 (+) Transcript_150775:79-4107(+)
MEHVAGNVFRTTVLVLVLFRNTVTSLRDMNEDVTLSVGTGGQTWKLAPLNHDSREPGATNGSAAQQNLSAQAHPKASDIQAHRPEAGSLLGPPAGDANTSVTPANEGPTLGMTRTSNESSKEEKEEGEKIEGGFRKFKNLWRKEKAKQRWKDWISAAKAKKTLEEHAFPSDALEVERHWQGFAMRQSKDERANTKLWWWQVNPFRELIVRKKKMPNNLWCPSPEHFKKYEWLMTEGEMVSCVLHHVTLYTCELPNNTCTSCSCDETADVPGIECVPDKCWIQLPYIWLEMYVLVPLALFLLHVPLAPVLSRVFTRLMTVSRFKFFVVRYLGRPESPPDVKHAHVYMLVVQVVASMSSVILYGLLNQYEPISVPWTQGSGSEGVRSFVPTWLLWILFLMNVHIIVNFVFSWTQHGFSLQFLFTRNAIIDILTAHGLLAKCMLNEPAQLAPDWSPDPVQNFLNIARPSMNWQFLRAYRALSATMDLSDLGALSHLTPIHQQYMKSALRLWAWVNTFAGIAIHFEWLGHDLALTGDQGKAFIAIGECASSADISHNIVCVPFFAAVYFLFSTISSVGFGDYAPESAPAYVVIIFLIIVGVLFFYTEALTLSQVVKEMNEGVRPAYPTRAHVVLTGGAMKEFDHSVILPFIQQLFHKSRKDQGETWPELVMLGMVEDTSQVREFLAYTFGEEVRRNITFCNADPLTPEGLHRGKVREAEIVYILPATTTLDINEQDELNLQVALSINSLTKTPFRVVLFSGKSEELAITSGIHIGQTCCINQLRTSVLAQSSRVRGWGHLLMLMSTQDSSSIKGAKEHCYEAMFGREYLPSLANRIRGFALNRDVAGRSFSEIALNIYRSTGALPICMQKDGRIVCFPWNTVVSPNTVVYVLHAEDFDTDRQAAKFVGDKNWKGRLQKARWKKLQASLDLSVTEGYREVVFTKDDTLISDADLELMAKKAKQITDGSDFTLLVVLKDDAELWPMFEMYIRKYRVGASREGGHHPLVVLVPDAPPQNLVDAINSQDSGGEVVFVKGRWNRKDDLIAAGILKCKVLIAFPLSASLNLKSTDDSRMFFFTQIVNKLAMRPECLYLVELASGMNSAHVLPRRRDLPPPPPAIMAEAAFHPACVSGKVFVPRMLISVLGVSYYCYGIVEVLAALTSDDLDPSRPDSTRPEQVRCPKELITCTFGYAVEALLQKQMGPTPALLLALVRETLDGEAVLLKPDTEVVLQASDLLIVLADAKWASWADTMRLRLFGGRNKRSSSEPKESWEPPAQAGQPFDDAPKMRPVATRKPMTSEEEEEAALRGLAADFGFVDLDEEAAQSSEEEKEEKQEEQEEQDEVQEF